MALLTGEIQFTGSLHNLSAYRMQGSNRLILRRKGGASRQRIKTDPHFEITRRNNTEWSGCTACTSQFIRAVHPLKHVAGTGYAGRLNGIFKSIQLDDATAVAGRRAVRVSAGYYKLEGFNLNEKRLFESIVKHPLQYSIDKNAGTALLQLPEIIPGINLANPGQHPLYRFTFILGAVADVEYDEVKKKYVAAAGQEKLFPAVNHSAWHTARESMAPVEIMLALNQLPDTAGYSILLAAGIEFGVPVTHTEVRPVKRDGAAKILKMM
jgi:hypothetical protein